MGSMQRCSFLDFRTGTLILGILSVIVSCCNSVYFISVLANMDSRIEGKDELEQLAGSLQCQDMECVKWFRNSFVSTMVCVLIVSCLHLIGGSILIKALIQMLPASMTAYIIQMIFFIGLMSVIAIMNMVCHYNRAAAVAHIVFPLVLSIAVDAACLVVAHKYSEEMVAQRMIGSLEVEAPSTVPNKGYLAWSY